MTGFITYPLLFLALYVQVFFLLALLDARKRSSKPPRIDKLFTPTVTIVVPCYNEEKTIARTLNSLLALDYPQKLLSIVVVDDGSKDNTLAVARTFQSKGITVIHKENGGKWSALNVALKDATSDLIGCLDADSYVAVDALRLMVQRFKDPIIHATTPGMVVANPVNTLTTIQKAEYTMGVSIKRAYGSENAIFITPGPFSIFRTKTVQDLGGWKHAYGTEDCELGLRLQRNQLRIIDTPFAHVYTNVPRTLYALYRQRVRWIYGFIMNAWHYRDMFFNRKYGALGMVLLPSAYLFMAGCMYAYILLLYSAGSTISRHALRIYDTSVVYNPEKANWFFVDTSPLLFVTIILVCITVTFVILGKHTMKQKAFSVDTPLYIGLYGLFAPWWIFGAVGRALFGKQAPWR